MERADVNLTDALALQAKRTPGDLAIDFREGVLSFSELHLAVRKCISHLLKLNVGQGDIVGLSFLDERLILIASFAVTRIGATIFLVPANLSKLNKSEMIKDVGGDLLLVDKADDQTPDKAVSVLTLSMLDELAAPEAPLKDAPDPSERFMIVHGSGSTGKPKLLSYSHAQALLMCHHQRRRYGNATGDAWASFLMLSFRTPLTLAMAAVTGGHAFHRNLAAIDIEVLPAFRRENNIAFIYAAPSHTMTLLEQLPEDADTILHGLKGLILSFASVSSSLREDVRKRLTPNMYISYGTNEVGLMTILPPDAPDLDSGSVGYVIENNIVEVVDKNGAVVPTGKAGDIRVRNDQNFTGYQNDREATQKVMRDGWFYTGDTGRFLEDGQLVHLGRSDHMMIFDGINIYPAEIERVVSNIAGISDVAVVPLASEKFADVPICAFAVDKGANVQKLDVPGRVRKSLGPRSPQQYYLLPRLPRTEQGKLDRSTLYEQIAALRTKQKAQSTGPTPHSKAVRPLVRAAKPKDLDAILEMVEQLSTFHGSKPKVTIDQLSAILFGSPPWVLGLIAEFKGEPVGYAALVPKVKLEAGQRGFHVHHLFVKRDFRRKGVGRALLDATEQAAESNSCSFVTVGINERNNVAREVYFNSGYVRDPMPGLYFRKNLANRP